MASTPFQQPAEAWYKTAVDKKSWTAKTQAGYRGILDTHLLPAFGHRAIGRINAAEIERMLAAMGTSPGTQRNVLRVLNPIMKHAIKAGMIQANPCSPVDTPKASQSVMKFLTAEQVRAVADEITPHYRTLVLFAAYTGMRAGEIAALQVKHVDLLRKRVTVERAVADVGGNLHYGSTKTGKTRTVPLAPFLVKLLESQMAGKDREDLVFTGPTGAALRLGSYYAKHFKPAVRRALPEDLHGLRFHDLRHTTVALLIKKEVHPKAIADMLGHSSIAITMDRYGHLYGDHDEPIMKKLEKLYKDAVPVQADVRQLR